MKKNEIPTWEPSEVTTSDVDEWDDQDNAIILGGKQLLINRREFKLIAKRLRVLLEKQDSVKLSHGQALELTSQAFGFRNWNTASASLSVSEKDITKNDSDSDEENS